MRIIAGSLRSRALEAPPGLATRPTSDRLRETLFNVLAPRIADAHFLDLYAGSGAVGIEALSRGAARTVFVERAAPALKILRANLAHLGLKAGAEIEPRPVSAFLRKPPAEQFHIVFLDPPYDAAGEYELALSLLATSAITLLHPSAVVIAEHRRKDQLPNRIHALHRTRLLKQGDASLSLYAVTDPQAPEPEAHP